MIISSAEPASKLSRKRKHRKGGELPVRFEEQGGGHNRCGARDLHCAEESLRETGKQLAKEECSMAVCCHRAID